MSSATTTHKNVTYIFDTELQKIPHNSISVSYCTAPSRASMLRIFNSCFYLHWDLQLTHLQGETLKHNLIFVYMSMKNYYIFLSFLSFSFTKVQSLFYKDLLSYVDVEYLHIYYIYSGTMQCKSI